MKKIDWIKKLTSRKFWAAVSGVVISLMVIFGQDTAEQERIAGLIASVGTLSIYILSEGSVDKASVEKNSKESDTESEE